MIPGGTLVLLSRPRYSIMSSVCKPTDTAAYSEYGVNLYSWMCSGRHTGCNKTYVHCSMFIVRLGLYKLHFFITHTDRHTLSLIKIQTLLVIISWRFFCTKLFFDNKHACCNRRVFSVMHSCCWFTGLGLDHILLVLVLTFWSCFHHCRKALARLMPKMTFKMVWIVKQRSQCIHNSKIKPLFISLKCYIEFTQYKW